MKMSRHVLALAAFALAIALSGCGEWPPRPWNHHASVQNEPLVGMPPPFGDGAD